MKSLVLVLSIALFPALVVAQDNSSSAPAAPTSPAAAPAPSAPASPAPAAPASAPSPLANMSLQTGLNMVDADINLLLSDLKTNSHFESKLSVMVIQGFDWKQGQFLTGVGIPVFDVGSYDYLAFDLFRQTTTGGGVGSKAIPMLANQVRLNALTTPAVKWGLSRVPVLNNNPDIVNGLANALDVGIAAGHDFNADVNQKLLINREVISMSLSYKFGGPASSPAPAQ